MFILVIPVFGAA